MLKSDGLFLIQKNRLASSLTYSSVIDKSS
jgi:hypothetical protein